MYVSIYELIYQNKANGFRFLSLPNCHMGKFIGADFTCKLIRVCCVYWSL